MDDGRGAGPSNIICWEVLQCAGKVLSSMGVNVASRKRRNVGQDDEAAWAGTIVLTSEGKVVVCVSDIK